MAMGLKMSMKLSQQLRMTPQLQQAIKLLQLSRIELEEEVRKEINENPILEEIQDSVTNDPRTKTQITEELKAAEAAVSGESDPRKQEEFEWEKKYVTQSIENIKKELGAWYSDKKEVKDSRSR